MKKEGRIITGLFVLMIFVLTAASFFSPVKERSESENRTLAQKPEFSFKSLFAKEIKERYTTQYEDFITDQFIGRDAWIGIKTYTERLLGKTDINGVYFAADGYLITKTDPSDVDTEQEEKNIARLTAFVEKYKMQLGDDKIHVMLVPTAASIFSEKLPAFAPEYDQDALLDRVAALFGKNWIETRTVLKEHVLEYLYYRTDHHWTALGAYYAYCAWAETLGFSVRKQTDYEISIASEEFYGTLYSKVNLPMKPDTVTLYNDGMRYRVEYDMNRVYKDGIFSFDRLKEKDKYMVYLDGNHAMADIVGQNKNGKKLLVIKDSYAHTFIPFIAQDYEEIVMIDFRYSRMPVSTIIENFGITDILVLYNAANFIEDENLYQLEK